MKKTKFLLPLILFSCTLGAMTGCDSPFIFTGNSTGGDYVPFKDTKNSIFFALYNYYGQDGQHFTNRWLGMKDALAEFGVNVTGDAYEKDAKKFSIDMSNSKLPKDTEVYMVNNQTWDPKLQFTKPLTNKKPVAVISTCNGVEFASAQIKANSPGTQNATMGGFSENYRKAFEDHSLNYLAAKYSAHIAPIFAAGISALDGYPLRTADNEALRLSVTHWEIKSLEEYDSFKSIDDVGENPTIKKSDLDPYFTKGNPLSNSVDLQKWCSKSTFEDIKQIYDDNRNVEDTVRTGKKLKVGLVVPGTVNEVVQAYVDYIHGYLAKVYNVEMLQNAQVTSALDQKNACIQLINQKADFIISLQDDTNRNAAIKEANKNKVYFANAGTCQNDNDYEQTKDLEYFVGSIGSSIEEERRATREMTKYYLQYIQNRGELK